jgi:methyl-accepting chemotaxis protein
MQLLSDGDLESEIYRSHQSDEIAAMANSLEIFRDSMIKARALSADQDKDRLAKAERATRMEARIVEFESTVRAALDSLQISADSMQTTAKSMSATADQSSALVSAVASAAEETSVNVQTVSAGTEELSSSIAEIGRQVVTSAEIARKAVDEAGATDATMQGLSDNAGRISVVIDLNSDHRVTNKPARAQRNYRGGAGGRSRPRICGGRLRSEEPGQPDRERDR